MPGGLTEPAAPFGVGGLGFLRGRAQPRRHGVEELRLLEGQCPDFDRIEVERLNRQITLSTVLVQLRLTVPGLVSSLATVNA